MDNMPVALLPKFAELCVATRGRYERVALVTDAREKESLQELFDALGDLWEKGVDTASFIGSGQTDHHQAI